MCVQSNTESEITKLKDKIAKTKDQLAQLYPKYDTERRNEEHAASQWVASTFYVAFLEFQPFFVMSVIFFVALTLFVVAFSA